MSLSLNLNSKESFIKHAQECTIYIMICMTQPGCEPMNYRMRGGHANH